MFNFIIFYIILLFYSEYCILLGRISALHSSEDESYQEILLLIRLLTHILSKDYVDFSDRKLLLQSFLH